MLAPCERVTKVIREGKTMEEAAVLKPAADLDHKWGNGPSGPIVEEVYTDLEAEGSVDVRLFSDGQPAGRISRAN